MSLAVVVPLFNGGPWIEETLRSVLAQELPPDEIVVVDDGGDDDGARRAAAFERVRVVPSLGKRRARHTGLLETAGEYVAFLDQDDVWHPSHLRMLARALEENPDAPAAFATWRPFRYGTEPTFDVAPPGRSRVDPWDMWPVVCPITTPSTVLFRREPLEAAGGWAVDHAPDWEVYLRLTGPQTLLHVEAATCAYRLHVKARSSELRRDGFAYLDIQRRGAEASWNERRARGLDAEAEARLEPRRRILEHLDRLMRAVVASDRAGVADAARALEADTEGEGSAFVDSVFAVLIYLFCPEDDPATYRRLRKELLHALRSAWPADAPRTRDVLVRHGRPTGFRWRRFARALLNFRLEEARRQWGERAAGST